MNAKRIWLALLMLGVSACSRPVREGDEPAVVTEQVAGPEAAPGGEGEASDKREIASPPGID